MISNIGTWFKNNARLENTFVFLVALASIFGPAFALLDTYNYNENPDVYSYLSIAKLDFNHNPARRYRLLIPFLASAVNFIFGDLFNHIRPVSFSYPDFGLCFSFFLVNNLIMAGFGLALYRLLIQAGNGFWISLLVMLAILSSRWVAYFSGLPFIDGLYFLACTGVFYAVYSGKPQILYLSIVLGFLARESFLLFFPVILLIPKVDKVKVVLIFLVSVLIQIGIRWYINQNFVPNNGASFTSSQGLLENMSIALPRLLSFHGLYEIFSILGFWNIFIVPVMIALIKELKKYLAYKYFWIWSYLIIVLIHAIISSELARMFFIASPVLALLLAKGINQSLSYFIIKYE